MKRILSIVLALALLLAVVPMSFSASAATIWTLVTDVSELNAGDQVIIVAKDSNYALSTTQATNNRGQAAVTKTDNTITFGSDVQVITLELQSDGTYAFNTGDGYLYCASTSSKNYLKTQSNVDDKAKWTISFTDTNGTANVVSKASVARNIMQYNTSSGIFACYSGTQQAICLYISTETGGNEPECEHTGEKSYGTSDSEHWLICSDCNQEIADSRTEHNNTEIAKTDSSCTSTGFASYICDDCEYITEKIIAAKSHDYTNGNCSMCGATAVFEFGENGDASHNDGSSITEYTETVNGYTLTLTDLNKVYNTKTYDAKGNSCLKLGTSSAIGSFTFTVPTNVTTVIIKASRYKSYDAATVNVNGTNHELTKTSDSGEYDEITVDTSTTKTVTFKTTTVADERAMVNSISFIVGETPSCTHANTTTTNTATYFNDGVETVYCEDCKTTVSETPVSAIKTAPVIFDDAVLDPETNKLTVAWTYSEALNEDIKAAATKGLAVKFAFGDKEYTVPNTVLNTEGGSVTIEGINADRFNKELTVKLEFAIGDYNTEVLNGAAIYTVAVNTTVDSENVKANAYNGLINAISNATEAVVAGAGTGSDDFTAGASSVDIKAGTATFKFVATDKFVDEVTKKGTANRTVKLVVTVDGENHEVTINALKTHITVTIKGLSFEQMYGSISAKLVITYTGSEVIDSQAVTFNFEDSIKNSDNTVAVALEELLKK